MAHVGPGDGDEGMIRPVCRSEPVSDLGMVLVVNVPDDTCPASRCPVAALHIPDPSHVQRVEAYAEALWPNGVHHYVPVTEAREL